MTTVFEFTTFVRFAAEDEDDACNQLARYLARPDIDCYAIGVGDLTAREVEDE